MGQGGTLLLVNGTQYDWHVTYVHSYQMNSWPFTDDSNVAAGAAVQFYIEWDEAIGKDTKDDAGNATLNLVGTSYSFQVQSKWRTLLVQLQTIETVGNAQGSTIDLGWQHDGVMPFFLSGTEGTFSSSNPPAAWMQSNIASLGPLPLRHLCIPGSHDAGMSVLNSGTAFVNRDNTITQTQSIGGQLVLGSRYFDCRPVISAGKYVSGHYSDLGDVLGWQGGNGQSFADIIDEINAFTASNWELVVLNLSHDLNTDTGRSYQSFTQAEWDGLLQQLMGLKWLFVAPDPTSVDLTTLSLNQFIGSNRAAVVVIVEPSDGSVTLGDYTQNGFYTYSQLNAYNSYTDTVDLSKMTSDQLQKMREVRQSPDSQYFLLSWTLTQDAADAIGVGQSILSLAASALPSLYLDVYPACSRSTYPNILFVDGFDSSDVTALAMAINTIGLLNPDYSLRARPIRWYSDLRCCLVQ